jgi:hypothetical protein
MQNLISSPYIEYDIDNDTYWLAGGALGVVSFKLQNGSAPLTNYFKPQGPTVNIPWSMTFAGDKLFVVNGGRWASQYSRVGQIMIYENGVWINISGNHIKSITGYNALDFMNVAIHPNDNSHFFVTSYGTGLYEFKNNEFYKWHNNTNSNGVIYTIIDGNPFNYIRLDGAIFDNNNNLLFCNMNSGVKVYYNNTETGHYEWYNPVGPFSNPAFTLVTLGKIVISNQNPNHKWIPSLRGAGIIVWDDNGTVTDTSDDRSILLSKFPDPDNIGSIINPVDLYCLTQDKNGVFWLGSDMGPLLFYNPSRAFEEGYTCSRVKIPRNDGTGLADYLLDNEKVKAIAVDGANRKWIGTSTSGLYLMSENGQETIHHFTTSNSPLLSNDILSIEINPITGEVFIGTGNGLVSFQSDAAEPANIYTNVYAYPNPVRENYNGIITITGLVEKTQVKITDINGNLIYQTHSNGSIATWDGKDVHGRRVNTGIYIAICANEDGTQSTITKIMVIN